MRPASRLRGSHAFDTLFNEGTRGGDKYFTVIVAPNQKFLARLGIAVSKKKLRTAVLRNRIKRLVRESFRRSDVRGLGLDIIVLPKQQCGTADLADLRRMLERRWESLTTFHRNLIAPPQSDPT